MRHGYKKIRCGFKKVSGFKKYRHDFHNDTLYVSLETRNNSRKSFRYFTLGKWRTSEGEVMKLELKNIKKGQAPKNLPFFKYS